MIHKVSRVFQHIRTLDPQKVQRAINEGLAWSYAAPHSRTRALAGKPLEQVNALQHLLTGQKAGCAYITHGSSAQDGTPLRVAFIGDWQPEQNDTLQAYERLLFEPGSAAREERGQLRGGDDYRQAAEALTGDADLLIVRANTDRIWTPRRGDWVIAPASLRMAFDFFPGETWHQVTERMGQAERVQLILQAGFQYHISHRIEDFQELYHQMYLPIFTSSTGAEDGLLISEDEARTAFLTYRTLLMISDADGRVVGGGLNFAWHQVLYGMLNGVRNDSPPLLQQSMRDAWYYFSTQWAYQNGCSRFDSGKVGPFLSDPGCQERASWGQQARRDPFQSESLLLWAPSDAPAALKWLAANPVHPGCARSGGHYLKTFYEDLRRSIITPQQSAPPNLELSGPPAREPNPYHFDSFGRTPQDLREPIVKGLFEYNLSKMGPEIGKTLEPFGIAIRDEQGTVIGGLLGNFIWDYLYIETLWVSEEHRGADLGTRLMRMAEDAARAAGIRAIRLETASYNAPAFYQKLGYEITGQEENRPGTHTWYHLRKIIRD